MAATLTAKNSFLTSLCPHLFYAQQYSRNIYMIYIAYNANIYIFRLYLLVCALFGYSFICFTTLLTKKFQSLKD